jgi:hypothetical protein
MTLAGFSAPSFASDAPKAPPPKEKEPTYANEEGATGRSGNVYKRVLKDPRGAPEPLTKEEPKPTETKKEAKDEKAKADDHAPKKEEKHDDGHGAPAKEEKKKDAKKDDGHGGGHKAAKKEEPSVSNLYDPAVIKLDVTNRPLTPVVQKNEFADSFPLSSSMSHQSTQSQTQSWPNFNKLTSVNSQGSLFHTPL